MRRAQGCKCGRRMFISDVELCFICGRGRCANPPAERPRRLRRLPRNLGAIAREGRRVDPRLDNVVRLDRLRAGRVSMVAPDGQGFEVEAESTPLDRAQRLGLTRREAEVLERLAEGQSNREIAEALVITEQTVKFHLTGVFLKVGARNRVEAASWWWHRVERSEGLAA